MAGEPVTIPAWKSGTLDWADADDLAVSLGDLMVVDQHTAAAMHAVSRTGVDFPSWFKEASRSFGYFNLFAKLFRFDHDELAFDVLRRSATFDMVRPYVDQPTLCLGHHAGYANLMRLAFGRLFPGGVEMNAGADRRQGAQIRASANPALALFSALRVLEGGNSLLISPDGAQGRATHRITVAGAAVEVATGAAFLAYETSCRSIWFNPVRHDERFDLEVIEAPGRSGGESFAAFSDRFYAFYAEQLDRMLCGSPSNIVMRQRWPGLIAAAHPGRWRD